MNKQQLQQEIAELQKQLEEKQKALAAMPDKWEPRGGDFWVCCRGNVLRGDSADSTRNFGVEYLTHEQAEKATKSMRAHNRLLAYVAEFAPDWEADWGSDQQLKYDVAFDESNKLWFARSSFNDRGASTVYMPFDVADELADKLNSGEVEL